MKREEIKRLVIMDFDGTLMATMTPDIGKPIWEEAKGIEWPHIGWWSKEESLDTLVFGSEPIDKVVDAYRSEVGKEGTHMVMMTGRQPKLGDKVKAMLHEHDLIFDEYIFNGGGSTISYKLKRLDQFIQEFPKLETLEIWEDREPHTQVFNEWGETQIINITVHQV